MGTIKSKPKDFPNVSNTTRYSFDIETVGLNTRRFIIGVVSWETLGKYYHKSFRKYEDMYDFMSKIVDKSIEIEKKLYFYAHSLDFDFYGVFRDHLLSGDIVYYNINHPKIYFFKENAMLLDNMAIFPTSLDYLGKSLGYSKIDTPKELLDENSKEEDITGNPFLMLQIEKYCIQDTLIVLEGLNFIRKATQKFFGFFPRKIITASQFALKVFKHFIADYFDYDVLKSFMDKGKIVSDRSEYKFLKRGMHGARQQKFQTSTFKNIVSVDKNWMYPWIMWKMKFPDFRYQSVKKDWKWKNKEELLDLLSYDGVAEVEIECPKSDLGYLPFRYKGETVYPHFKCVLRGHWTHLELYNAITKYGYRINKVVKTVFYEKSYTRFFEPFVQRLVMIQEKYPEMDIFVKRVRNALFGKFAQTVDNSSLYCVPREDKWKYPEHKIVGVTDDMFIIRKDAEKQFSAFTQPYISAKILAMSRDYMFQYLSKIDKRDLIYTDTDSIYMKRFDKKYSKLFDLVNTPDMLEKDVKPKFDKDYFHKWKIEKYNISLETKGNKVYRRGDDVVWSGVPKKYRTVKAFEEGKVKIQKMNTLISNLSDIDKVGTFSEETYHIKDEETKSRYVKEIRDLYYVSEEIRD